jgi:hypothetical protein
MKIGRKRAPPFFAQQHDRLIRRDFDAHTDQRQGITDPPFGR